MKTILTLTIAAALSACGTTYIGPQDMPPEETGTETSTGVDSEEEIPTEEEEAGVDVEVTTTTTTTVKVEGVGAAKKEAPRREVGRYELRNENAQNTEFIGANYCLGSSLRDCWIRSGYLTKYSDGTFKVSIEFWDTYDQVPYTVHKESFKGEHAILLTDKAKTLDDTAMGYRHLWAVVVPDELALGVIYDYAGDGPNVQGDDMLDALEFHEIETEGN